MGIEAISAQLGQEYNEWSRTFEAMMLRECGISGATSQFYTGRGRLIKLKEVPLLAKARLDHGVIDAPGGYGVITRLWATIHNLMKRLAVARKSTSVVRVEQLG